MSFKNKVRKIVGDCYNQVILYDQALITNSLGDAAANGTTRLFRVATGWQNVREELLLLMNATLSAADIAANRHLWLQGQIKEHIRIRNPTNVPIHVELVKCTLKKCGSEYGYSAGVYNPGTLPFVTGSANANNNRPEDDARYWTFWDQSSRESGAGAFVALNADHYLMHNSGGVYDLPTVANSWERSDANLATFASYLHTNDPLSWVFPKLRAKCRIRTVFKGWIGPEGNKAINVPISVPREIRPRDIVANTWNNWRGGQSYFYFIRVHAKTNCAWNGNTQQVASSRPAGTYLGLDCEPLSQVVLQSYRKYGIRAGSDSLPTFQWMNLKAALGQQFGWRTTGTPYFGSSAQAQPEERFKPRQLPAHPVSFANGAPSQAAYATMTSVMV